MTVRRYPSKQLHNPGSDRVLCSTPLPAPALVGGDDDDVDWVARGLTSSGYGFLVASTLRWLAALLSPWGGEGGGGGEEACGIPVGGEEDEDRGREVQGGVDEAQRGREEEVDGSIGGRDPYGVPRVGGELGRGGRRRRRRPGTGQPRGRCPPVAFWRGGSLLPPPVDRRGPMAAMARSEIVIGVISR